MDGNFFRVSHLVGHQLNQGKGLVTNLWLHFIYLWGWSMSAAYVWRHPRARLLWGYYGVPTVGDLSLDESIPWCDAVSHFAPRPLSSPCLLVSSRVGNVLVIQATESRLIFTQWKIQSISTYWLNTPKPAGCIHKTPPERIGGYVQVQISHYAANDNKKSEIDGNRGRQSIYRYPASTW